MKLTEDEIAKIICEVCEPKCVFKNGQCGDCRIPARVISALLEDCNPDPDDLELTQTGSVLFSRLVQQA